MFELSIVIPTHNRASDLMKRIMHTEEALGMTCEWVIVDRASDDSTPQVLDLLRTMMPGRLKVICEGVVGNPVNSLQKGLERTTGRLVLWLDDNAILNTQALREVLGQFDQPQTLLNQAILLGNPAGSVTCMLCPMNVVRSYALHGSTVEFAVTDLSERLRHDGWEVDVATGVVSHPNRAKKSLQAA